MFSSQSLKLGKKEKNAHFKKHLYLWLDAFNLTFMSLRKTMILSCFDTNPSKEKQEYVDSIKADLN